MHLLPSVFLVSSILFHLVLPHRPPHLVTNDTEREVFVRPYDSVILQCPVSHNKLNIYEWYKEKMPILPLSEHRLRVLSNGALKIKNVLYEDTGFYRCRAVNGFGSVEFNTTLLVIGKGMNRDYYDDRFDPHEMSAEESKISLTYKPRILFVSERENEVYKNIGEDIKFQCVATGFPTPEMLWFKDGVKINNLMERWSLSLFNATIKDSGNYTCMAKNTLGSDTYSFILHMNQESKLESSINFLILVTIFCISVFGLLGVCGSLIYCRSKGIKKESIPMNVQKISSNSQESESMYIESSTNSGCSLDHLKYNQKINAQKTYKPPYVLLPVLEIL